MLKSCLFLCIFVVIGSEAGSASFIKPCVWSDKKCILESSKAALPYFVKGIPELDILPADPIYIKDINADNGDFKLHFNDLKVTGMGKSVFINVERPDQDKTIILEFEFPGLVTGNYKAGGRLYVIDVFGEGQFEVKTDKIRVKIDLKLKRFEKAGKVYRKISGFDYSYDPIERVSYKFTNLYNGDEEKAKIILDLINQNWKDILLDIGKPVIKEIVNQEVMRIQKLLQALSIDELEKLQ